MNIFYILTFFSVQELLEDRDTDDFRTESFTFNQSQAGADYIRAVRKNIEFAMSDKRNATIQGKFI